MSGGDATAHLERARTSCFNTLRKIIGIEPLSRVYFSYPVDLRQRGSRRPLTSTNVIVCVHVHVKNELSLEVLHLLYGRVQTWLDVHKWSNINLVGELVLNGFGHLGGVTEALVSNKDVVSHRKAEFAAMKIVVYRARGRYVRICLQ